MKEIVFAFFVIVMFLFGISIFGEKIQKDDKYLIPFVLLISIPFILAYLFGNPFAK